MKPKFFKEYTAELKKPESMTDEECSSLYVHQDRINQTCISLWTVPFWQRVKFLFHGHIWLGVLSGKTQPPVWLNCTKTVFIKPYTRADDTDELVSYKPDAMAVNGLSEQQLINEGLDVKEVCKNLDKFIIRNNITTLIGHCSDNFDLPRIKYLFERFLGINIMDMMFFTNDTHAIAKRKLTLPNYKLKTICEHFGIKNTKEHSALGDTYATYEVYKKLTQN